MGLEIVFLREVRERQTPHATTHMWNLEHNSNELTYKAETESQTQKRGLLMPRQEREGAGMDHVFGMSRCKPLYIEWINNKVLLYGTGNL